MMVNVGANLVFALRVLPFRWIVRVELIDFPAQWIGNNVLANAIEIDIVADDVIVVVTLP